MPGYLPFGLKLSLTRSGNGLSWYGQGLELPSSRDHTEMSRYVSETTDPSSDRLVLFSEEGDELRMPLVDLL